MPEAVVTVIVAVLGLAGTWIGSYFGTKKSAVLTAYRLEQLEKTVAEKTTRNSENNEALCYRVNKLEARSDIFEEKFKVTNHRIDDLEKSKA